MSSRVSPSTSRFKKAVLLFAALLVVAAVLGVLWWQDGPRRLLEQRLQEALGLDVSISAWSLDGSDTYRVEGLGLRSSGGDEDLRFTLDVEQVHVVASIEELLTQSIRELRLKGAHLSLILPEAPLPDDGPAAATGRIEQFELVGLGVSVCRSDDAGSPAACRRRPTASLTGQVHGTALGGPAPTLELELTSSEASTRPVHGVLDLMDLPEVLLQDARVQVQLRSQDTPDACGNAGSPLRLRTQVDAGEIRLKAGGLDVTGKPLRIDGELALDPETVAPIAAATGPEPDRAGPLLCRFETSLDQLQLRSPDLLEAVELADLRLGSGGELTGADWKGGSIELTDGTAPLPWPVPLDKLAAASVRLRAARLSPWLAALGPSAPPLDGHFDLHLHLPTDDLWTGRIDLEATQPMTTETDDGPAYQLSWSSPFRIEPDAVVLPDGRLQGAVAMAPLPPVDIAGTSRIRIPFDSNGTELPIEARFELPRLTSSNDASGVIVELGSATVRSTETLPILDLEWQAPVDGLLQWSADVWPGDVSGLAVQGDLKLDGTVSADFAPGRVLDGELTVESFGSSNAAGDRVLDGLGLSTDLNLDRRTDAGDRLFVKAEGQSSGFLVLWETLFADLSQLTVPFDVELGAPWPGSSAGDLSLRTSFQPTGAPRVDFDADLRPNGDLEARLVAASQNLAPFYETVAGPLLGLIDPDSDGAPTSSMQGKATVELDLSRPVSSSDAGLSLRGRIDLEDLAVTHPKLELRGFTMSLPLHLEHPSPSPAFPWTRNGGEPSPWTGSPQEGDLGWQEAVVLGIPVSAVHSDLLLQGDRLRIDQPLILDLLGGRVEAKALTAEDLLSDDPQARLDLRLDGLSLAALTESRGLPSIDGRLDGDLRDVTVTRSRLKTSGGGTLALLGGTVQLRDISGSEILTEYPRLRVSADLDGIDLAQLTGRFDVGQVTGLLDGRIDRCELFHGVPTTFEAELRTRKQKGVSQTVDVKAVKNLTILGTGQGGAHIFDRGVQRFLSHYRYSALGVRVRLRDDVLFLEGLERRGDKELFLKGGFPFGIDIVNARPGQTVSFQTMVGRLQSLDFGAVDIER